MERLKHILSWILWPFFFIACIGLTSYGFSIGQPILFFNISYLFLFIGMLFFERFMPHEPLWTPSDGQAVADILHTLSSKGTVQGMLYANTVMGAATIFPNAKFGFDVWPTTWPLWAQVSLAVVASEFMLYWAHRTAHEHKFLWRFHAIHHSVTKLWVVNTGRFHFMDSLYKIVLGLIPLLLLGAPMEMIKWVAVVTAFIGVMTHCNVEMRFGPLSWIFNTPELHRWHHSKDLREGDKNYGENVVIWDILLGTYFREHRRPPVEIGIKEPMPVKFRYQIIWPFLNQKKQNEIIARNGDDSIMRNALYRAHSK
jgi:sterol desaturase/sphingolipid hydroxylase (fatty acid hydroxylase superfamily)